MDGAQTDVDDDVVPEPDSFAVHTEVVDSSPSRELVSLMQGSSLDWTKPPVVPSSAQVPDSKQHRIEHSASITSPPLVGLGNQKLLQSTGLTQVLD